MTVKSAYYRMHDVNINAAFLACKLSEQKVIFIFDCKAECFGHAQIVTCQWVC